MDPLAARVRQLTDGVRKLSRASAPRLQRLASRLARDVKRAQALHPSAKLKRQAAALKSLRAALTRYRQGRRGAAAAIRTAARKLT